MTLTTWHDEGCQQKAAEKHPWQDRAIPNNWMPHIYRQNFQNRRRKEPDEGTRKLGAVSTVSTAESRDWEEALHRREACRTFGTTWTMRGGVGVKSAGLRVFRGNGVCGLRGWALDPLLLIIFTFKFERKHRQSCICCLAITLAINFFPILMSQ